jgi:transposase
MKFGSPFNRSSPSRRPSTGAPLVAVPGSVDVRGRDWRDLPRSLTDDDVVIAHRAVAAASSSAAITAYQQEWAICQDRVDRHGEAGALNNLGLALHEVRRFEEAITTHQQGLVIYREFGDRHSEVAVLDNLGLALRPWHTAGRVRRPEEAIAASRPPGTSLSSATGTVREWR